MNSVDRFDNAFDALADKLRGNPPVDKTMYRLTEAANHSMLWHGINLAMLITGRRSMRDCIRLAGILGLESALINGLVKKLFRRQRPVHDSLHPHRLRQPKTTSFPSGHATSAFCAAVILSDGASLPKKIAWFSLAKVISWTRIHVRIHHASDVGAGAVFGVLLGVLASIMWPRHQNP